MNILTEELKNHQIERRLFKVLFNLQHISQVNIMLKDCSCNIVYAVVALKPAWQVDYPVADQIFAIL